MKLSSILIEYSLNPKRTKLVRHPYSDEHVKKVYDTGFLEAYQNCQSRPVFDNCDNILVFLGTTGTRSLFLGCYSVGKKDSMTPALMPDGYPYPEDYVGGFFYNLQKSDLMADLVGRLIIDWGLSRNWAHWAYTEKEIIELQPLKNAGTIGSFKSFEETFLSYPELKEITSDTVIYDDWYLALSSINAIYLILDTKTGKQYVGSSYGQDGLFSRWKYYVDTRHGDDEGIKSVLKSNPEAYKHFQFTILRVLPKTITPDEAIQIETLYKKKLGTRRFGMNRN